MYPAWLLVVVAMGGLSVAAASQCWDDPSCQDLSSDSALMDCIQVCQSDLSAETPVIPGPSHLQLTPLDLSDPAPSFTDSASQAKRSYSMEHFRWGKPVGRKRRPIKVYTSNDLGEEESVEVSPSEMRRALSNQLPELELANEAEAAVVEEESAVPQQKKKNGGGVYKMKHFRWSSPPESKRYGGFMKSWDERSQRPLLTLFKNVIHKDQQMAE
uniref:Proopiomelanocortin a n=1 Tax=Neogobius melanostomus TaxID=47308 RepID=A0A8C6U4N0_9GOBI